MSENRRGDFLTHAVDVIGRKEMVRFKTLFIYSKTVRWADNYAERDYSNY